LDTLIGTCQVDWDDPSYEPTAASNHQVTWIDENDEELEFELWDTAGQEALRTLRQMSYPDTDVFLLGYDMCNPDSLANVKEVWFEEVGDSWDDYSGIILVGTKYDLWLMKQEDGDDEICTSEEIAEMAKEIGAKHSVYTSAKTGYGLPFDAGDLEYATDDQSEMPPLDELIIQVYKAGPDSSDEEEDAPQEHDFAGVMMPLDIFEICCRRSETWTVDDKTIWRNFLKQVSVEDQMKIAELRSVKFPDVAVVDQCPEEAVTEDENAPASNEWPADGVPDDERKCKMVIVGDGAIGKSCLLDTLTQLNEVDWDDPEYRPTAAGNLNCEWDYMDQDWEVELWDTAGQEALKTLRLTAYDATDVFVIGYDMCNKDSLDNVEGWVEEIHDVYEDECGLILVGTKHDLWEEKREDGDTDDIVTEAEVAQVAEMIGAKHFIYTSAKTGYGLVEEEPDGTKDLQDMIMSVCAWGKLGMDAPGAQKAPEEAAPAPEEAAPAPVASAAPGGGLEWPSAGYDPLDADLCRLKAVVVGDGAVGKTCLLDRITDTNAVDWENPEYVPTAAANQEVEWCYEDMDWSVELWDPAGQEALRALRAIAYPESHVFMLTYSMTSKDSLENIPDWLEEIEEHCQEYYGVILVGTKHDLWLERVEDGDDECVTEEAVAEMAAEIGATFSIYTSAMTGYGLDGEDAEDSTGPDLSEMILDIGACGRAKDPAAEE
jgi:small GTP-binding protein